MKQNIPKKRLFVLLLCVIAIWSIVGWTFLGSYPIAKKSESTLSEVATMKDTLDINLPRYKIQLNNRDPFFVHAPIENKRKPKLENVKMNKIKWPKITFVGVVQKASSFHYLFKMNGRLVYWKNNERKEGIHLRITKKQFVFSQHNEKKILEFESE